jgi:hypothetical protein
MKIQSVLPVRNLLTFIFVLAVILAGQRITAAQNVTAATVSGVVEDANGASVAGATLTATNVETNRQSATSSDRDSHFKFARRKLPTRNRRVRLYNSQARSKFDGGAGALSCL